MKKLLILSLVVWGSALAQSYPTKPVRLIVNGDTVRALADADVKKRFADLGVEAVSSTPAEFAAFIKAEQDKYARLIRDANIKVNP